MIGLLVDHNIEQHGKLLWGQFSETDWRGLNIARIATLQQVGLDSLASDREIWLFCQREAWLLLTANRNMLGQNSLEAVIRQLGGPDSLPVLTLADPDRVQMDSEYRALCAYKIASVAIDIHNSRGITRIFVP
jgi:hypothetical protein